MRFGVGVCLFSIKVVSSEEGDVEESIIEVIIVLGSYYLLVFLSIFILFR